MTSNAPALSAPTAAPFTPTSTNASRDDPPVPTAAVDVSTEALADDARAALGATTPSTHTTGADSSSSPTPPSSSSVSTEHKLDANTSTAASATKGKRVFVFQKRWLHSLPIIEKTLPESGVDCSSSSAATSATKKLSNGNASPSALADSLASSRDVIVCMLCDDPGPTHHTPKMWHRLNCRRGRIENHLTSKHPEFMLLLKHKRDTEGELAVQLFLQGMRDGRCSLRSELSLGILAHPHQPHHAHALSDSYNNSSSGAHGSGAGSSTADGVAVDLKRGFPGASVYTVERESASTPSGTSTSRAIGVVFAPPLSSSSGTTKPPLELDDLETRRKRARLSVSGLNDDASSSPALANGSVGAPEASPLAPSVLSSSSNNSLEASALVQWQSVLFNHLVVVTGGENLFIASLATNLWLLGANVLLTFTSSAALDAFTASHAARFPDADTSLGSASSVSPRGVLCPMLGAFQTRAQMDEWSRTIAARFAKVDYLINFVDDGDVSACRKSTVDASPVADSALPQGDASRSAAAPDTSGASAAAIDFFVSSANRLLVLCQSISTLCFQPNGAGAIVNITTQSDNVRRNMNCAAVESMTKSLALELQPLNVQVNCILLQQSVPLTSTGSSGSEAPLSELAQRLESVAQDQQNAALSHTILFLLSPANASAAADSSALAEEETEDDEPSSARVNQIV